MRPIILAATLITPGCAGQARKPCEFDVHVRVTAEHDEECREAGAWRTDSGEFITDMDTIYGCATAGLIITNGTPSNMGHEMAHQVDRNCK